MSPYLEYTDPNLHLIRAAKADADALVVANVTTRKTFQIACNSTNRLDWKQAIADTPEDQRSALTRILNWGIGEELLNQTIQAHRHLVMYALLHGCSIDVFDPDQGHTTTHMDLYHIMEELECTDDMEAVIRHPSGSKIGWFRGILEYDQAPDEIINDYSDNEWFQKWSQNYALL